jgi:hypothetical protein
MRVLHTVFYGCSESIPQVCISEVPSCSVLGAEQESEPRLSEWDADCSADKTFASRRELLGFGPLFLLDNAAGMSRSFRDEAVSCEILKSHNFQTPANTVCGRALGMSIRST